MSADPLLMLDICAGLAGASRAMKSRGWNVITLDYDPKFNCTITADIRTFVYEGKRPDLIWCSPPCDEFSREFMPWSRTGIEPSTEIVMACKKFINSVCPQYWVIENVKGAIRYFEPILGNYRDHVGPYYLWGYFPDIGKINLSATRKKESFSSSRPEERAEIPYQLSFAFAKAIEINQEIL